MPKMLFTENALHIQVDAWDCQDRFAQAGTNPDIYMAIPTSCSTNGDCILVYVLESRLLVHCQQYGAEPNMRFLT